ncbi:YdaS family helix-turn-helix protein [Sphingomonas oryzagri]
MDGTSPFEALEQAALLAGGQSGLARICNKRQSTVWYWLHKAKQLPGECVLAVEAETGVSRHDLRPDLYPLEQSPVPAAAPPSPAVGDCGPVVSCDRPAILQRGARA